MAACTVNGTTYPAWLETTHEPLTRDRYTQGQTLVTSRGGSAASRRIWPVSFGILTASELATLRGLVKAPGTVTVGGEIVGSPSVTCLARDIEWYWGDLEDIAYLSCEFVEVSPS